MLPAKNPELSGTARIVGTIHSPGSLRAALALSPTAVDLLEVRVDAFAADPEPLFRSLSLLPQPLIVTVRGVREGGAVELTVERRRELYKRFLPFAQMIDIEAATAPEMADVVTLAKSGRVEVIASFHDFQKTPAAGELESFAEQAVGLNADILKIATHTATGEDLAALLSFLHRERRLKLSVMGMGPLGRISRLLFARIGSVLNYGYLDKPQVSGQWPAPLLKTRLEELAADPAP